MGDELGLNRSLFDRTVSVLGRTLDYRVRNQRVITSNIANIDTPGYRPKQLKFDEELRKAVDSSQIGLRKTDRNHLPGSQQFPSSAKSSCVEEISAESIAGDASLDIDREMAKMAKNNLLYEATVKMLSRKFDLLRTAIEEKR